MSDEPSEASVGDAELNQTTMLSKIQSLKRKALDQIHTFLSTSLTSIKRPKEDDIVVRQFKSRVASYQSENWYICRELNPRFLSERGWRLVDSNMKTVKCDSCGCYLNLQLPNILNVDIKVHNRCLRNIIECADSSHEITCIAKSTRPLLFPHFNEKDALSYEMNSRLNSLRNLKIDNDVEDNVSDEDLSTVFTDSSIDRRLMILAVTGYDRPSSKCHSVSCSLCLRVLSLSISFLPSSCHYTWCPYMDIRQPNDIPQWKAALDALTSRKGSYEKTLLLAKKTISSSSIASSTSSLITLHH